MFQCFTRAVISRARLAVALVLLAFLHLTYAALPPRALAAEDSFEELVKAVEPSIVIIEVPDVGLGSGFIADSNGSIVTNYHVIEGAKSANITFFDKTTVEAEGFLGFSIGKDLAILRLKSAPPNLEPLVLSREDPSKGEKVLAFGAPKGLGGSVSDGIVSAMRAGNDVRDILKGNSDVDIYTELLGYDLDAIWIQTTAPISGGNSGGPLVNREGEVVGLNTWARTDGQNLNFAICAKHILEMLDNVSSEPHAFAELPKPRERSAASGGAVARTLEYWNQIAVVNRHMFERMRKLSPPSKPSSPKKVQQYYSKLAGYYKRMAAVLPEIAAEMKALDIADVDVQLVALATADAQAMQDLAAAIKVLSEAAEKGQVSESFDSDVIYKKTYGDVNKEYDILRITLTQKYGESFPNLEGDAPKPKVAKTDSGSDKAAKSEGTDDEREKQAARKLAIAKQLKDAKKTSAARDRLKKVIAEYAGTAAAAEAQKLLDELED